MEAERDRCLAAGMSRVLTKPVAWVELFEALASFAADDPARAEGPGRPKSDSVGALPPLDEKALAALAKGLDPDMLQGFLTRALTAAEQAAAELAGLEDRAEMARVAHRLRGTAASFGLVQVAAIAGSIEEEALQAADPVAAMARLGEALRSARVAIEAAVPATPEPTPLSASA